MRRAEIECEPIIDKTRPTTRKNVIICAGHRLLKVDTLDNRAISEKITGKLTEKIHGTKADGVVFCDFRHGIFSPKTTADLIASIPEGVYKVADSQVASRWGNILDFPNERETRFALGDQDSVVRPLARNLYQKARCKTLIMKLGSRGALTYRRGDEDPRAFFSVDSFADNVVDPVGAGDALLAYATLTMIATRNEVMASILGSMAAAVACQFDGNKPVTPQEVRRIIDTTEKQAHYAS
jgi:bifunctional ADP-heptose synthase (sugar kinase/adenylyltransferase)